MDKRQIVLDTETTGLEVNQGIGSLRSAAWRWSIVVPVALPSNIHPQRDIDAGAVMEVHGITLEFLPESRF